MKEEGIRLKSRNLVIDASVILGFVLPDEDTTPEAQKYFSSFSKGEVIFNAPGLLKYEVANGLKSCVKRARLTVSTASRLLTNFLKMNIKYIDTDYKKALRYSISEDISIYDASYLELAKRLKVPLVTLDSKLSALPN